MKKPILLLTVMLMTVTMLAQNSGKISIQVSGKPLYEVLSEIQNLSGFTFFYSRDAVAMQEKVDFTATKEPVKEAITSRIFGIHNIEPSLQPYNISILLKPDNLLIR